MKTNKAFNRLSWRFTNGKGFTPNQEDKDALNEIIKFVNRQQSETVKNNQLFAKLYIYNLNQELNHFESTVIDKEIQIKLHRLLDMPLESFYKAFHSDMKQNQVSRLVETKGVTKKELINSWNGVYNLESVTGYLDEMIFKSLNKLS